MGQEARSATTRDPGGLTLDRLMDLALHHTRGDVTAATSLVTRRLLRHWPEDAPVWHDVANRLAFLQRLDA